MVGEVAEVGQEAAVVLYSLAASSAVAAVLGFVGAGGLGQMLYVTLSLFQQPRAMTVILAMIVMVLLVDALSAWLRARLG